MDVSRIVQTAREYDDVIAQLRHRIQALSSRVQQYGLLLAARRDGDVNALASRCAQLADRVSRKSSDVRLAEF